MVFYEFWVNGRLQTTKEIYRDKINLLGDFNLGGIV
jgi:hypothetical protein